MIKAVSFDFWDTIALDDSDEIRREAMGLRPKSEARKEIFVSSFLNAFKSLKESDVATAYEASREHFKKLWHEEQITQTVAERFQTVGNFLKVGEIDKRQFEGAIQVLESMEVMVPPDPVSGAIKTIESLSKDFNLAIISDTIVTPGQGLRGILKNWGILLCFQGFSFSDEVGRSKPDAKVFQNICEKLNIAPNELVHVGDRYEKDIKGAQDFGAHSILFTGAVDRSQGVSQDILQAQSYNELEETIRRIAANVA